MEIYNNYTPKNHKDKKMLGATIFACVALGAAVGALGLYLTKNYNIPEKPKSQLEKIIDEKIPEVKETPIEYSNIAQKEIPESVYFDSTKNYFTTDYSTDKDYEILARLIFGEARGESDKEKAAVAYTVINRANDGKRWNGESIKESALVKSQYSCFNEGDANQKKVQNPMEYEPQAFKDCLKIAYEALYTKKHEKFNKGQTHYFNPNYANPSWAESMDKVDLGNTTQVFYREN